jgi:hypothetical protein
VCNSCGDKFTANELGPLVAPGAAHPDKDTSDRTAVPNGTPPAAASSAPTAEGENKPANSDLKSGETRPEAGPDVDSAGSGSEVPVTQTTATQADQTDTTTDILHTTPIQAKVNAETPQATEAMTTEGMEIDHSSPETSIAPITSQPADDPSTTDRGAS